jgi:hypothetical protein
LPKGYIVRLISYENLKMVNICDEEILGKELKEGELTVNINRDYFSGFWVDEEKAVQLVREADIINLVGNRIVRAVLKERLAHPKAARKISNVAFLMIYRFRSKG